MIIRIVSFISVLLLTAAIAQAEPAQVDWSYPQSAEVGIDGFRMYEIVGWDKELVFDISNPNVRTQDFDLVLDQCRSYFLVAYKDGIEATPSQPYGKCPDIEVPGGQTRPLGVDTITIRFKNEIQQ